MRTRQTTAGAAGLALVAALAAVLAALLPSRHHSDTAPPAQAMPAGVVPSLAVTELQLGRAIGLDKRITDPSDVFDPTDTVYVSVVTAGDAAHAQLATRWTRQGQLMAEVSQTIAPHGAAVSEFDVWKPHGWPPGEYQVEVLVDGVPAGARSFVVR